MANTIVNENERTRDGSKIFGVLREAILRLELAPGSVIDEANLGAQLRVSRTPIREAIIQLIAEGLVIRDGRTARVAPLDFNDVPRIYEALLVSSRMIHRLAAENRQGSDLERIHTAMLNFEQYLHQGNGVQRQDANVAFHMEIAKAAENDYFKEFYERMLITSSRLSRACFSNRERGQTGAGPDEELAAHIAETARQHRLMFDAIEAQDVEASDRLAVDHQKLSFDRLQRTMFTPARSVSGVEALGVPPGLFSTQPGAKRKYAG